MNESSSAQVKPLEIKEVDKIVSFGKIKNITTEKEYVQVAYENGNLLIGTYDNVLRLNFYITADSFLLDSDIILLKRKTLEILQNDKTVIKARIKTKEILLSNEKGLTIVENNTIIFKMRTVPKIINDKITVEVDTAENVRYFGFGEKPGQVLNKQGTKTSNWSTDIYAPHCEINQEMYGAINFSILNYDFNNNCGIFIDNPSRINYGMTNPEQFIISADYNAIDMFIVFGPTMKNVIENYTLLTGRSFLPPKWALGNQQSRHSYENEEKLLNIINTYEKYELPLSAVYLDILYMEKYRLFTLNNTNYPNIKKIIADALQKDLYIIPIVDAGIAVSSDYTIYNEGIAKNMFVYHDTKTNKLEEGEVWPGICVFPDIYNAATRQWWGMLHQFYTDFGIKAIWNDMNEPAVFCPSKTISPDAIHHTDFGIKTHKEVHNKYGYYILQATYYGLKELLKKEKLRPFLVTRSAYAGTQKYAAVWTGDNFSYWWQLKQTLPMCLNLSLSGINMVGTDIGGFAEDSSGELLTRWYQGNIFFPFVRNHNAIASINQEPWAFGKKYLNIIKKFLLLRYQFLPTMYSLAYYAHKTGIGMIRPLFLEYGEDEETYKISDQYLLGADVLLAPILEQEQTNRLVYLPKGKWIDYFTNKVYDGRQYLHLKLELAESPIFIRDGSIIVKTSDVKNTNYQTKEIYVYATNDDLNPTFSYFDDDGKTFAYLEGNYTDLTLSFKNRQVTCKINSTGNLVKSSFSAYLVRDNKIEQIEISWG